MSLESYRQQVEECAWFLLPKLDLEPEWGIITGMGQTSRTCSEAFARAVGPHSQDGKTAQRFISQAREAMKNTSPLDKAFGKKS